MESILNFIVQNKEWLFSGVGVAVLSFIFSGILARAKKPSNVIRQSNITRGNINIQMGRDVNINVGNNSDEKIIESLRSSQSKPYKQINKD
jgi:hypothetical protein